MKQSDKIREILQTEMADFTVPGRRCRRVRAILHSLSVFADMDSSGVCSI